MCLRKKDKSEVVEYILLAEYHSRGSNFELQEIQISDLRVLLVDNNYIDAVLVFVNTVVRSPKNTCRMLRSTD